MQVSLCNRSNKHSLWSVSWDRVLAHPSYWSLVVDKMKYLDLGKWLGNNSIDHFLLQDWVKVKDTSFVLYLGIYAVESGSRPEGPNTQECSSIRRWLLLPEEGVVPLRPVACILCLNATRHYVLGYSTINASMWPHWDETTRWTRHTLIVTLKNGVVHILEEHMQNLRVENSTTAAHLVGSGLDSSEYCK
jgi:hypothetical protein